MQLDNCFENVLQRIHYKILSMLYDILHTSKPQYFRKLIQIKPHGSTRSSDYLTLIIPKTSALKISSRSFTQSAPILWNNLLLHMRTCSQMPPRNASLNVYLSISQTLALSKKQLHSQLKMLVFKAS